MWLDAEPHDNEMKRTSHGQDGGSPLISVFYGPTISWFLWKSAPSESNRYDDRLGVTLTVHDAVSAGTDRRLGAG
jgi:hypothetical protein